MYHIRLWPTVAPVIRSVIGGRSDIINSVKNYGNPSPVSQSLQPWNTYHSHQQLHIQSHDRNFELKQRTQLKSLNLYFSTTPTKFVFEYPHNENDDAHRVLRSLPAYISSTVDPHTIENSLPPLDTVNSPPPLPNTNWALVSANAVAGSFMGLSRQCKVRRMDINSSEHKNMFKAVADNVGNFSNEELKDVLAALTLWPSRNNMDSGNFNHVWSALDVECMKRLRKWDLGHSFLIADLWYRLRLSRTGCYNGAMLSCFGPHIQDMAPHHLVQFLFLINLNRETPANVSFATLERRIAQVIDQLTLEEIGVIAMGIFKTQTYIKTEELNVAFYKIMLNSDFTGVSNIILSALFKVLRKSQQTNRINDVFQLLNKVLPYLPQLSFSTQLQVALFGNNSLVFNPEVFNKICENFINDVSSLRLKEIERLVFTLLLYNYIPPEHKDILEIFSEELRKPERLQEINQFTNSFVCCVTYMTCMGYIPADLVSSALKPDVVRSLTNTKLYFDSGRELLDLDCALEIEGGPAYTGNRLEPDVRMRLMKSYADRNRSPREAVKNTIHLPTHQERLILDVEKKLMALLSVGEDTVTTAFLLPHVAVPDIVFCCDRAGTPVTLPAEFLAHDSYTARRPLSPHPVTGEPLQYNVLIVGGRNSYIRGTGRVRGQLQMKIRYLAKLGYNVLVVSHTDYVKRSLRYKLLLLNTQLEQGGALAECEQRAETAFRCLRATEKLLEESQ